MTAVTITSMKVKPAAVSLPGCGLHKGTRKAPLAFAECWMAEGKDADLVVVHLGGCARGVIGSADVARALDSGDHDCNIHG